MQTAAATASHQLTYFNVIVPLILTVFGVLQLQRHLLAVNFNNDNVIDALTMANMDGAAAKIGTFNNVALMSSSSVTSTEGRDRRRRSR